MRCAFPGCFNSATGPTKKTFALVHAKTRLANLDKWKEVCGVEEFNKNASICEAHFRDEDFVNPNSKSQGLKPTAIPTWNPRAAKVVEVTDEFDPMGEDDDPEVDESSESVEEVVEIPAPPVVAKRQGRFRYVGEIDEDALDCSPKVRRAFKVLKKTIRQDKARLGLFQKRNSRLREENELLKKVLDESEKDERTPAEVLKRIVEDGLKKEEGELMRKFVPKTVRVGKRISVTFFGKISCRMCLGTRKEATGRSAFSSFAGEDFLSDVIETCFGIRIEEHDFCTKICEECLVKVDIAWKLYSEFQSNQLALKEFYRRLKEKKIFEEELDQATTERIDEEEEELITSPIPPSEPDSSDSECYSLPDHPFFIEQTKSVYLCHLCDKQFERSNSLDYHLYTNHQENDQDQLCQYCAKFVQKRQIRKHLEIHTNPKPVCSNCNETFHNPQNLERHMVVHTKERPYPCTLCDLRFTQAGCLKLHVQRVHMAPKRPSNASSRPSKYHRKPATCPVCFKDFKISRKLIDHVEETHPEHELEVFTCELCLKQFISAQLLRAHRAIFHPSKEFHCDRCGQTFPTFQMLGSHLRKHEKKKASS